jgi:hypothetical protein
MLVGLRQAWASKEFKEEPASYNGPFGADRVDAARIGLELIGGNQWPIDEVCEKVGD